MYFRRGDHWSPFYFAHLPHLCRFTTTPLKGYLICLSLSRGGTQCRSGGLRAANDRPYSHSHTSHRRTVLLPFVRFTYVTLRHRPLLYLTSSFTTFRRGDHWSPFYFALLPPLCRFLRLLPSRGIQQWQYYTLIFKTPKFLFFLSIMDKSKKQCK